MKKISTIFPLSISTVTKQMEKERQSLMGAAGQFAELAKASSYVSEIAIAEEMEKERQSLLGVAGQFAELTKASSYVSGIAEQVEKENRSLLGVASFFTESSNASSYVSAIAEQMKKEMLLLSGVKDQYALFTKDASSLSAIAEQIAKERWIADMGENLSKVASGASGMLKQFEIMGINTTEILSTFENTINTLLPKQSIAADLNVVLPAINVEFTASQDRVAPNDASTHQESPTYFQYYLGILFFFFLKSIWEGIVIPQFNDKVITPIVDSYLESKKSLSEKEKIYGIRRLVKESGGSTDQTRFITGNRVNLRSGPSAKTEILTKLDFGQVVTILNKKRDWVEVTFKHENEILQGWVSVRYVGKFK